MNAMPLPRRLRSVLAALCLAALIIGGFELASSGAAPRPDVYAVTTHGKVLRSGAKVRAHQSLTIYARGFAPRARVEVVDAARRRIHYVRANSKGVAHTRFVVPRSLRHERRPMVALAGVIAQRPRTHRSEPPPRPRRHPQALTVTVPLLRKFAYRLTARARGHDVEATTIEPAGSDTQGLADTGFDVIAFIIAGVVLVLLGANLQINRRRRRLS